MVVVVAVVAIVVAVTILGVVVVAIVVVVVVNLSMLPSDIPHLAKNRRRLTMRITIWARDGDITMTISMIVTPPRC
jgi:hypothetical protein